MVPGPDTLGRITKIPFGTMDSDLDSFLKELDQLDDTSATGSNNSSGANSGSDMSAFEVVGADDLLGELDDLMIDLGKDTVLVQNDAQNTELAANTTSPPEPSDNTTEPQVGDDATNNFQEHRSDSKRSLKWRDESEGNEEGLEDVRAFDKREPADDVNDDAPTHFWPNGRQKIKGLLLRLYLSHFLSAWGDRMWEFASALLLISIWPDTLLLAAMYGLAGSGAVVFFGPSVGDWVDQSPRLDVVRKALFVANGSVVVATILIGILLASKDKETKPVLVTLLLLCGSTSSLGSLASTLAVEKEWVKILCGDDSEMLAETNARMRRIDLICKLVAPIFVGLIMSGAGAITGTIVIGVWNFISMFPEYLALTLTYHSFPKLKERKTPAVAAEARPTKCSKVFKVFISIKTGWKLFSRLDIFRPALALSLLYCTVLSFGSIMTAYAYNRGVNEATLAVFRGVGAGFGLLGTFIYPRLSPKFGLIKTGGISIWSQVGFLALCLASTFYAGHTGDCSDFTESEHDSCIHNRNVEMGLLISGVVISRCGLWMFDLAVTQMLQERVPIAIIATVNGTQSSIQNLLDLFSYVLGVMLNRPQDFTPLVWISFAFVFAASLLYTSFWHSVKNFSEISSEEANANTNANANANINPSPRTSPTRRDRKRKKTKKYQELNSTLMSPTISATADSSDDEMELLTSSGEPTITI
eukprot:m.71210 g.71210  ORF g.71210 m.71210 type:complete len:700 (+) comp24327_c0_seq1:133-2232(+)